MPPYAYVPGQGPRHDERVFAPFHASVRTDMDVAALQESLAWRAGWVFLEQGYGWEAHEVFEPIWMALPDGTIERSFVQAAIQTANALVKQKMKRPRAVLRLCDMVESHLSACGMAPVIMGRVPNELHEILHDLRRNVHYNASLKRDEPKT